jgi:DNA-directed RNA polymerase subunit beta
MNVRDNEDFTPIDLKKAKTLSTVNNSFFGTNQLSQFMDQINPLSELAHKRRLSSMGPGGLSRERAGFEVRDAHATHYGRICTVETPEGANIGLVLNLAQYARINDYGFIETPYRKVTSAVAPKDAEGKTTSKDVVDEDGKVVIKVGKTIAKADIKKLEKLDRKTVPVKAQVTTDIVYLGATDEQSAVIAGAGQGYDKDGFFENPRVSARTGGTDSEEVDADDVTHMDAAPQQIVGISAGLIPFLERNYVYRSLMGANQQRQAVPLVRPESPIIGTGLEGPTAKNSGQVIVAEEDGEVVSATANEVVVKYKKAGKKTYKPYHFVRSNDGTSMNQKVRVSVGDKVEKDQPIIEGMSIADGELALGHDAMVAFMQWDGYNF